MTKSFSCLEGLYLLLESQNVQLTSHNPRFLAGAPTRLKADLRLPRGVGEKLLLRCLAARPSVGLARTALEPKRAIQFGSRIAKLEVAKERGGDRAVRV